MFLDWMETTGSHPSFWTRVYILEESPKWKQLAARLRTRIIISQLPRLELWPGWGRYRAVTGKPSGGATETQHRHNDVERLHHCVHTHIYLYDGEAIHLQMASLISVTMEVHHFNFTAHWSLLRWILLIIAWHFHTYPISLQRSGEHSWAAGETDAAVLFVVFHSYISLQFCYCYNYNITSYNCKWVSHCQLISKANAKLSWNVRFTGQTGMWKTARAREQQPHLQ